jgi:hypothetical protein
MMSFTVSRSVQAQQSSHEIEACKNVIRNIDAQFAKERVKHLEGSYCIEGYPVVKRIIALQNEFPACVAKLIQLTSSRSNLIASCLNNDTRKSLSENTYMVNCLEASYGLGFGYEQITFCANDVIFREKIVQESYQKCIKQRSLIPGQKPGMWKDYCNNPEAYSSQVQHEAPAPMVYTPVLQVRVNPSPATATKPPAPKVEPARPTPEMIECLNDIKELPFTQNEMNSYCQDRKNQSKAARAPLLKCVQDVTEIVDSKLALYFCAKTKEPLGNFSPKALSCVKDKTSIYFLDYLAGLTRTKKSLDNFEKLIMDCQVSPESVVPYNNRLTFISARVIPHDYKVFDSTIGGLSALNYNEQKDTFSVISDDQGFHEGSRMYEMKFDIGKKLGVVFKSKTNINSLNPSDKDYYYNIDAEGIVVTKSGQIITSCETPNDGAYLKTYDFRGFQTGEIPLSQKFMPKNDFLNQVQGVYQNKSFESLAALGDEAEILFTANEAPLFQDNIPKKKLVRIVKLVKTQAGHKTANEFVYQIENLKENGIVDIVALDEFKLLTLERRYDREAKKTTVQIFETNLKTGVDYKGVFSLVDEEKTNGVKVVEKKLLLNLNDILPYFPPALAKVDNIEGMSLGPKLANGNRTLVLVSDDNFSQDQVSQIIALEFTPE